MTTVNARMNAYTSPQNERIRIYSKAHPPPNLENTN
jgi:hypothetical protein